MQCLPNHAYRIKSATMGLRSPLTVHFNRLKAVRKPVEEVSGNLIPEEEIPVEQTVEMTLRAGESAVLWGQCFLKKGRSCGVHERVLSNW